MLQHADPKSTQGLDGGPEPVPAGVTPAATVLPHLTQLCARGEPSTRYPCWWWNVHRKGRWRLVPCNAWNRIYRPDDSLPQHTARALAPTPQYNVGDGGYDLWAPATIRLCSPRCCLPPLRVVTPAQPLKGADYFTVPDGCYWRAGWKEQRRSRPKRSIAAVGRCTNWLASGNRSSSAHSVIYQLVIVIYQSEGTSSLTPLYTGASLGWHSPKKPKSASL